MADVCITVRADGDSWKIAIMQDTPVDDRELFEMISLIADTLRSQFDLKV